MIDTAEPLADANGRPADHDGQPHDGPPHDVVLFDGLCNLCSTAVNFIIAHDSRDRFRFASLQSDLAAGMLKEHGLSPDLNTVVMIDVKGRTYTHSTAVLRIASELDAPWPLAVAAALVPMPLRDAGYEFVSKHRVQWFGRRKACRMPTDADRDRFLA